MNKYSSRQFEHECWPTTMLKKYKKTKKQSCKVIECQKKGINARLSWSYLPVKYQEKIETELDLWQSSKVAHDYRLQLYWMFRQENKRQNHLKLSNINLFLFASVQNKILHFVYSILPVSLDDTLNIYKIKKSSYHPRWTNLSNKHGHSKWLIDYNLIIYSFVLHFDHFQ